MPINFFVTLGSNCQEPPQILINQIVVIAICLGASAGQLWVCTCPEKLPF